MSGGNDPSPGRVFVVPGHKSVDSVRRELEDAGLDLYLPADFEEATALIADLPADLILFEPAPSERIGEAVRALERSRHDPPPILVLAGYALGPLEARILFELGVTDVIFPPHHPRLILAKIGALLRLQRRLDAARELSMRDELTGLYNRRFFSARLEQEIARSLRTGEGLALILFDIDHFKKVNDTFGHPTGDAVLRAIAEIALAHTRKSDLIARMGGDEFALLLSSNTLAGAGICAEGLRRKIAAARPSLPAGVTLSGSFGVACFPHPRVDHPMEDLVGEADKALLLAKSLGRNQVATLDDDASGAAGGDGAVALS